MMLFALVLAAATPAAAPATYRVSTSCGDAARCFASIQAALDAATAAPPADRVIVAVGPGDYREKVVVRRDGVRLRGAGAGRTRLHFDAVAEHAGRYDRAGWGTAGSATLTIAARDVTISDMTVENSFDYLANDAIPRGDPRRMGNAQGVALMLDTGSDRVLMERLAVLGHQDTLFTRGRRALFREGTISGNIDFIFGDGALLIERSVIRSRRRAAPPDPDGFASYVAAPSTPVDQPVGIVVHASRLVREAGVADRTVALARPWHPTTTFADGRYADPRAIGQAVFLDCRMDAHIHPDHWTGMAGTARDGTKTHVFRPQDSRFLESGSTGPGSRRRDIGIAWTGTPTIAGVRRTLRDGWGTLPRWPAVGR